ncbi:MAG: hypothetical protein V4725_10075, partial [Bacteroidota bacterium]
MRLFFLLCVLFLYSCSNATTDSLQDGAAGNWLIVYADHQGLNAEEATKYQPLQDSIVDLYGLKLIQLLPGGVFQEMDSLYSMEGRWDVFQDKKLLIADAGKGFGLFVGDFVSLKSDKLRLIQKIVFDGDSLPLQWAWRKIREDSPANQLFEPANNTWRKKSAAPETDIELKKRLASMLHYYAIYFDYISQEAIYFLPRRLALPFNYHAHMVAMKQPDKIERFAQYFHSPEDAQKAFGILKTTKRNL